MTTSRNASGDTCVVTVRLTARQFQALGQLGPAWVRDRLALVARKGNVPLPVKRPKRAVEEGYVMQRTTIRLPTELRELYNGMGGSAWLRERLDAKIASGKA